MEAVSLTTKPHYPLLDGLRGVAAIMVVAFHLCEAHSQSHLTQVINHGYLAVDFFFLLSGFVMGYAYDDRWDKMTFLGFVKRRLVRLQPMVVIGMVIGAVCFYFQGGTLFPLINQVPVWKMLLVMLIGCTLIPVPMSMDIRGWGEMHPLNGPGWSLFFEYIANLMYALFVRKFSRTALSVLVFISAGVLVHYAVTCTSGDMAGGWSLEPTQLRIGFTRLMYPFFGGLLLSRISKPKQVKNAFLWCSLLIIMVLSIPRIGGADHVWMNGLYESLSIIFVFPLIVFLGAGGDIKTTSAKRICKFLGDISYPIYMTHYPLIYIYTAWAVEKKVMLQDAIPTALATLLASILLAYGCLKFYDEPVRLWLKKKILKGT